MGRGRPRKPTATKKLDGTYRKDRALPNEPEPEVSRPEPPEGLSPVALEEWNRITPELEKLGLLTQLDRLALAGYVACYARWREADAEIKKSGMVVFTKEGFPCQSPYLSIANQAMRQMLAFLREFGLSPASRTKVSSIKPSDEGQAFTGKDAGSTFAARPR